MKATLKSREAKIKARALTFEAMRPWLAYAMINHRTLPLRK